MASLSLLQGVLALALMITLSFASDPDATCSYTRYKFFPLAQTDCNNLNNLVGTSGISGSCYFTYKSVTCEVGGLSYSTTTSTCGCPGGSDSSNAKEYCNGGFTADPALTTFSCGSKVLIAAIIGGIVGGVVFLVLVVILIVYLARRNRKARVVPSLSDDQGRRPK